MIVLILLKLGFPFRHEVGADLAKKNDSISVILLPGEGPPLRWASARSRGPGPGDLRMHHRPGS